VISTNLISRWSFEKDTESRRVILINELQTSDRRSLAGGFLISIVVLFLWQLGVPWLKSSFLIEPPLKVVKALQGFFLAGMSNVYGPSTIWPDIRLSLLEITGGIVVSGLIGFLIVEGLFKKKFSNRVRALLCLTAVAPVVLASQIMFWVGIGIWQKILTITCFMCFPFMQALSSYRNLTLLNRLLTALDEAMPYAFVGMVFAEAMAATAGLGFLMIIAGSQLYMAEAIAISFLTFGLMTIISCSLRFVVKRLCFSEDKVEAVPSPAI